MHISNEFRASHNIIAAYKILRDAEAKADFSLGWGPPLNTAPTDVIDINGDGQANFTAVEKDGDGYKNGGRVVFDEPSLVAPSYKEIEGVAREAGKEVLTQEDFGQGLFLARLGAEGKDEVNEVRADLSSAEFFLASRQPWDPGLRYAVDTKAGEFLLYK
ncbi:MAG: hypothetical protein KF760_10045 [Candidatus Eremiobacteraeota bacterium]|nr:hypothetical protein [Candidatus Eremiobacteraeota bacterium]MCW5871265.1 hypothetical protein [Candidatus Eremiobacteraeota bacterium]